MGRKHQARGWVAVSLALGISLQLSACGDDAVQQVTGDAGDAGEASTGGAPDGSAGSSSGAGDANDAGSSSAGQAQGGTPAQGGAPVAAGGDDTVGAGGAAAGAGGAASNEPGCPAQPPTDDGPCETAPDLTCGYGSDPRPNCRALFRCMQGTWELFSDGVCDGSSPDCPADADDPPSNVCGNLGISCVYPASNRVCDCRGETVDLTWWCSESPGPNCPVPMPNYGTACDGAATCVYQSAFCNDWEIECVDGLWSFNAATGSPPCDP